MFFFGVSDALHITYHLKGSCLVGFPASAQRLRAPLILQDDQWLVCIPATFHATREIETFAE